ncbi:MAG TPA: FtsX-like permease family protein, partial [Longimicrobiales bacterium]|nr:FtsX-like permease family protein [Longimicrobiales bacterium]
VTRRTREIGVRMALGSRPERVRGMLMSQGLRVVGVGLVLGLGAAVALTRFMEGVLFEVSVHDPLTFGAVVLVLLGVSLLATWLPARRAARVSPMEALRAE